MVLAGHHGRRGVNVAVPVEVQQADQFVTPPPVRPLALGGAESFIVHRVVVLVEPASFLLPRSELQLGTNIALLSGGRRATIEGMDTATVSETAAGVPSGYLAIPVNGADEGAPLRICVLVRQTPDPAAGHFILLRDFHDARVYLGCVRDHGNRVREWLELWVQNLDGLEGRLPAFRETFSNASLDARWKEQAEAFCELDSAGFLRAGWESVHPRPVFLDLGKCAPVHPAGPGGAWELCREDRLLEAAGLPAFRTSLTRYLYQPDTGAESRFIPVTADAPENSATRPLAEVMAGIDHHLTLNPQGGLMMAKRFSPLGFENYVDLLGGKSWSGIEHGKKRLTLDGVYRGLTDWTQARQDNAHLFLGRQGRAGRFVESFHLKLQLLADAFTQVRSLVRQQQLPLLNLTAESFRVSLGSVGTGLPVLWTARCSLVRPSAAFVLPVETSEFKYFIRPSRAEASIYLPEGLSGHLQGSGTARVRKVMPPELGRTMLEGTLVVQERLPVSPHDLLWIRLPLATGRLDLYGHLYATESLAAGEIRFRTVRQQLPESVLAALRAAEGLTYARAPFEVVPLLSSPCDLYSLGVLAVRALLVDETTTLAVALDEVLSLARQTAAEHKPEIPLGARIRAILERDPRYAASLGPHRLGGEGLTQGEAGRLLPTELWCDTLGLVVSLFPGMGPDSISRDFGDVPALALETVFDRPVGELEKLLVRSRSLIMVDWTYNREVSDIIQACLGK